jgi:hypothetical protein
MKIESRQTIKWIKCNTIILKFQRNSLKYHHDRHFAESCRDRLSYSLKWKSFRMQKGSNKSDLSRSWSKCYCLSRKWVLSLQSKNNKLFTQPLSHSSIDMTLKFKYINFILFFRLHFTSRAFYCENYSIRITFSFVCMCGFVGKEVLQCTSK